MPGQESGSRPWWTLTSGVLFCLPMQVPERNPLVTACITVGSPSPPGMGSTSCQRCSTSPHCPTFSLGCFFPTTAALTQCSNCPGLCVRAGQHGAGLVLSPVTQPRSAALSHHSSAWRKTQEARHRAAQGPLPSTGSEIQRLRRPHHYGSAALCPADVCVVRSLSTVQPRG